MSANDDEGWNEYVDTVMERIEYLEHHDEELETLMGKTFSESVRNIANTIPSKYSEHVSVTYFVISSWLIDKGKLGAK